MAALYTIDWLCSLVSGSYQEIVQQRVSTPEFGTVFGPVVDNLVVPNQPHKIMGQYNEMFSQ